MTHIKSAALEDFRRDWVRHGYFCIENGAPDAECAALAEAISAEHERLTTSGWKFRGGGIMARHLNCEPRSALKPLLQALEAADVEALVSDICGEPMELTAANSNANFPGSAYQDFHPDGNATTAFVIVNVALVDTDQTNGATELVPGTHAVALDYRSFVTGGHARRGVRPTLRRGDIMVRTSTLWHRGTPNRSRVMRPMLALLYTPVRNGVGAVRADQLTGPVHFYGNRFGAGVKGRLMEFMSVHLPWIDHLGRMISRTHGAK